MHADLQYDPLRDFAPITLALATPYLATVQAGLPVNSLPEFPTIAESGLAGYEATSWQGVVAPAGTPRAIVMKLNSEILRALQLPDIGARLAAEGAEPGTTTPDEFAAYIRREIVKWAKVVRDSGVKLD